jgi:hypothetical protein
VDVAGGTLGWLIVLVAVGISVWISVRVPKTGVV